MKVYSGIKTLNKKYKNVVVAIGVFDGLHRGHTLLIKKAVERARKIKGTSMVMTFSPHPVHVLRPNVYSPLLVSLPYRIKLIEELGVDVCIVVNFTKKFSELSPEVFIKNYLVEKINPEEVIVGDDFRFGHDREGTLAYFQKEGEKYGFSLTCIKATRGGIKAVSSTRIRELVSDGKLAEARKLLGRPVRIWGHVVHGDARGSTLGYPTANINPSNEVVPPSGVYFVNILIDGKVYNGISNVGRRPSFKRIAKVNVEVHIFNFKENIYGKDIVVEFLKKIRNEKHFLSRKDLIKQISLDEKKALAYFSKKHTIKK